MFLKGFTASDRARNHENKMHWTGAIYHYFVAWVVIDRNCLLVSGFRMFKVQIVILFVMYS